MKRAYLGCLLMALFFFHAQSAAAQTIIVIPDNGSTSPLVFQQRGTNARLYQLPSARALVHNHFAKADLNGDNILSPKNKIFFSARIKNETRSASGTNILATRQYLRLRHHYNQADRNNDDDLTRAEWDDYMARYPVFAEESPVILFDPR